MISVLKGDAFLASVADNRPELQEMDLADCDAVTDGALSMLMERFSQLHPDKVVSVQKGGAFCATAAKQVCLVHEMTTQFNPTTICNVLWCD